MAESPDRRSFGRGSVGLVVRWFWHKLPSPKKGEATERTEGEVMVDSFPRTLAGRGGGDMSLRVAFLKSGAWGYGVRHYRA